jgi:cytoplasmic iron level regulating protein YaaA (DUF328/UPF0246 family)
VPSSLRILVPLSDRKKPGGREGATLSTARASNLWSFRTLSEARLAALDAFRAAMAQQATALKTLGMKDPAFREAYAINRALDRSRLATALERCNGTFAETLRPKELPEKLRRRLDARIMFVCPLLGVLAPCDRLPDYRCPEGAKLPGVGSLHKHWKPEVTAFLNRVLRGKHVISFLPTRLAALWEPDGRAASIASVRFGRKSEKRAVRGETAAAPGLVGEALRFVLEHDVETPAQFARFESSLGHAHAPSHDGKDGAVDVVWFVR